MPDKTSGRTEERRLEIDGETIDYILEWKNVKNLNLRISADGQVHVSANRGRSPEQIENFIRMNGQIVKRAKRKFANKIKGNSLKNYSSGEEFYLLGIPRKLVVEEGWEEQVMLEEDSIRLIVRDADDICHKKRRMDAWIAGRQKEILLESCQRVYPLFHHYHLSYPEIKIKAMKSQWGNCRPSERIITLNSALIHTPKECITYVTVHEFAHFIEQNHSPAFYRVVAEIMPDYKRWEKLLNMYLT